MSTTRSPETSRARCTFRVRARVRVRVRVRVRARVRVRVRVRSSRARCTCAIEAVERGVGSTVSIMAARSSPSSSTIVRTIVASLPNARPERVSSTPPMAALRGRGSSLEGCNPM